MKINLKKLSNPYMLFGIAWSLSLFLYVLGWSKLFPPISTELLVFLTCAIVVFVIAGILFGRVSLYTVPREDFKMGYKNLLIVNFVLTFPNFVYCGVPLLSSGIRDFEFGIPVLIVIAVAFNSFCAVYCFYLFLIYNKKSFLLYTACCLLVFALEISRGLIMMSVFTMFFLWMNVKHPVLTFKKAVSIISGVLLMLYLFGVAGNYRTITVMESQHPGYNSAYGSDVILNVGDASDSFRDNIIPNEYFWSYIYVTSPLSNLQYNITIHSPDVTLTGLSHLLVDELVFDAVSKRIDGLFHRERPMADLVVPTLTVPTTLAGSYNYAGWVGMAIFILFLAILPVLYLFSVAKNPLGVIGISILCTIYFLSMFDNMLILTGLSFQLLFPIIFYNLSKIKLIKRRMLPVSTSG